MCLSKYSVKFVWVLLLGVCRSYLSQGLRGQSSVFECILSTWNYLTKRFQTPIHVTCDALEIGWRSKVVLVWSFPWNISWSLFMFVYVHSYLWLHNHSYDYQQGCLTNILAHVLFSGNWYRGTLSTIWIAYTLNRVSQPTGHHLHLHCYLIFTCETLAQVSP